MVGQGSNALNAFTLLFLATALSGCGASSSSNDSTTPAASTVPKPPVTTLAPAPAPAKPTPPPAPTPAPAPAPTPRRANAGANTCADTHTRAGLEAGHRNQQWRCVPCRADAYQHGLVQFDQARLCALFPPVPRLHRQSGTGHGLLQHAVPQQSRRIEQVGQAGRLPAPTTVGRDTQHQSELGATEHGG